MLTDIKLGTEQDETEVVVESRVLKAKGSDVMIDSPDRRSSPRGFRRALVHDSGDGLTVNFNGDYPGGVTINNAKLNGLNISYVTQGMEPELPRNGKPGDLLFIHHGSSDPVILSQNSLWICVPHEVTIDGAAHWQQIPLSEPVAGTA